MNNNPNTSSYSSTRESRKYAQNQAREEVKRRIEGLKSKEREEIDTQKKERQKRAQREDKGRKRIEKAEKARLAKIDAQRKSADKKGRYGKKGKAAPVRVINMHTGEITREGEQADIRRQAKESKDFDRRVKVLHYERQNPKVARVGL